MLHPLTATKAYLRLQSKLGWMNNKVNVPLCGIFQKASAAVVGSRGGATSPPTSVVAACAGAGAGRPQPPWRATPQTWPHTTLYPQLTPPLQPDPKNLSAHAHFKTQTASLRDLRTKKFTFKEIYWPQSNIRQSHHQLQSRLVITLLWSLFSPSLSLLQLFMWERKSAEILIGRWCCWIVC